jgi:hypothetical protein
MDSSALVKSQKRRAGLRLLNLLGIATCLDFYFRLIRLVSRFDPHVVDCYIRDYK